MNPDQAGHSMNQKIFQMGLSVETVSVYLLCCGLEDAQTPVSVKNLADIWNGTPDQLTQALAELETRKVIHRIISDKDKNTVYKIEPPDRWACH